MSEVLERVAKARKLRYKKSIAQGFNIEEIKQELFDLQDEMDSVRYFEDADIDELVRVTEVIKNEQKRTNREDRADGAAFEQAESRTRKT